MDTNKNRIVIVKVLRIDPRGFAWLLLFFFLLFFTRGCDTSPGPFELFLEAKYDYVAE